jgi:hypothetical protein
MCEKSGWCKCVILFRLVNIPTVGTRSCLEEKSCSVKKWDNRIVHQMRRVNLPRLPFRGVLFSKTGQGLKSMSANRWEGYPLFKRQRLLLLVFLSFLSCS